MCKIYFSGNFHPHQEQHTREKPFMGHVERISLAKLQFPCVTEAFYLREIGKNILTIAGHLQLKVTHTGDRPNKISNCG